MVIVQHSEDPIHNGVVKLSEPDVYAEYGMYNCEEQHVQQMFQCRSDSLLVVWEDAFSGW